MLAEKAALLNFGPMLRIGKGEEWSGGRNKPSILAGAFEAVLGGVYKDGGYEAARTVVERFFSADVTAKNSASMITRQGFRKSARCCITRRRLIG